MLPQSLASTVPIATMGAAAFYLCCTILAVSRRARNWAEQHLAMPVPATQAHLAPLDALRGLAALYVATFHAWQWYQPHTGVVPRFLEHGPKAVPIFVVLSGFLIFRAARGIASRENLQRYLRNRFLRIYPLYATSVIVVALTALAVPASPRAVLSDLLMLRALGAPGLLNPQTWSLSVEVLFYLLLPCFAVLTQRRALLLATSGFAALSYADLSGPRELALWKYFFAGVIASELHARLSARPSLRSALAIPMFIAGGALFVLDAQYNVDWVAWLAKSVIGWVRYPPSDPMADFTVGLAIAVVAIVVGAGSAASIGRVCARPVWRMLAAASYGIFIWHGLLIVADAPLRFDGVGGLAASGGPPWPVALGWWVLPCVFVPAFWFIGSVSFVVIERPFLMLRRRSTG